MSLWFNFACLSVVNSPMTYYLHYLMSVFYKVLFWISHLLTWKMNQMLSQSRWSGNRDLNQTDPPFHTHTQEKTKTKNKQARGQLKGCILKTSNCKYWYSTTTTSHHTRQQERSKYEAVVNVRKQRHHHKLMHDMIGWMKEKNRASRAAHFNGAIFWPSLPNHDVKFLKLNRFVTKTWTRGSIFFILYLYVKTTRANTMWKGSSPRISFNVTNKE